MTITALARRYVLEVNLGSDTVPVWTQVIGLADFKPAVSPTDQDSSNYNSDGWGDKTRTAADWSVELKLNVEQDEVTYEPPPTHVALQDAAWSPGGPNTYVEIRYYDRNGNTDAWQGTCLVTWSPDGGDRTALGTVSATLSGHGALVRITNPAGTDPAPSILSLNPASGGTAGGELVTILGAHFIDASGNPATDVDFGANPASSFTVVNTNTIVATSPAASAGSVDVSVTSAAGTSATVPGSSYTYA